MIAQSTKRTGPSGTILVADDTAVMRHACQRALERAGHRVVLASNGEEAIAVARAERIDVALLDIKMPGPSGIDVLRKIKTEQPLVEVIMMTAYATQDVAEEATHLGAGSFLTKPFSNIKTLTDAVSKAITKKRLKEEGFQVPVQIADIEERINAIAERADPEILAEIFGSGRILKLEKAQFEPVSKEGPKSWSFRIEGVITEVDQYMKDATVQREETGG